MREPTRRVERPAPPAPARHRHDLLHGATLAGLVAGAAMLAWAVVTAAIADVPPARPLALTAATFADGAAEGGPAALAGGLVIWAAVSVLLALFYAVLIPRSYPFSSAALVGMGYAFVLLGVVTSAVLPRVNEALLDHMTETGGAWVLAFAVFGLGLGLVPALRRRHAGA